MNPIEENTRRNPYPEPPANHEPITAMEQNLRQRLSGAVGVLKGPLWVPLIERGLNKTWIRMCGEPGPGDRIVYDIEFFKKANNEAVCVARLSDETEAENLCQRLNQKDPTVRELGWVYVKDKDSITHQEVDYYQMEGRFWVVKKLVGPK